MEHSMAKVIIWLKRIPILIGVFVLVIAFQNCKSVGDSKDVDGVLKSTGNGEPYTGFTPNSGVYYSAVEKADCAVGVTKVVDSNVDVIIEVDTENGLAQKTTNCGGASEIVALDQVTQTANNELLIYEERMFQKLEAPPREKIPFPVAFCNVLNPVPFDRLEHLVVYNPKDEVFGAVSVAKKRNPLTGEILKLPNLHGPLMPQEITVLNGVPAVQFTNFSDYTLVVTHKRWFETDPFHLLGAFFGNHGNQAFEHSAVCLALANKRQFEE